MKLATLLLGILLATLGATTGTAAADEDLRPPGGPVYVSDPPPMRAARGEHRQRARKLRRALVETFDVNGDGRLGPRERMRAVRVLRRIERRLASGAGSPAAARKLRRLDRDRDGWGSPGED